MINTYQCNACGDTCQVFNDRNDGKNNNKFFPENCLFTGIATNWAEWDPYGF